MPFRCFASSDTSPVAELAARDAPAITGDTFPGSSELSVGDRVLSGGCG